jgi:hypothetical protein
MNVGKPPAATSMKALTMANRVLLRAMKRHEAAARVMVARGVELGNARRQLALLVSAISQL